MVLLHQLSPQSVRPAWANMTEGPNQQAPGRGPKTPSKHGLCWPCLQRFLEPSWPPDRASVCLSNGTACIATRQQSPKNPIAVQLGVGRLALHYDMPRHPAGPLLAPSPKNVHSHWPFTQSASAAHLFPQDPQFAESVWKFLHRPLHSENPAMPRQRRQLSTNLPRRQPG